MTNFIEEWKPIVGYEGLYEISSFGRVRSARDYGNSYIGKILTLKTSRPYHQVTLSKRNISRYVLVHSLVAEAFIGPRPKGLTINHIDGNKRNNNVTNLEYVTQEENRKHAIACDLLARGSDLPQSKLDETKVKAMRELKGTMPYKKIAAIYGVTTMVAWSAVNRKSWQHVE